ncbi:MAG TPA: hypothetical protein VLT84_00330, partial [Acidobacteriota bacterium]|nr:hypothetical protein [Acidobacteriota bacterium]
MDASTFGFDGGPCEIGMTAASRRFAAQTETRAIPNVRRASSASWRSLRLVLAEQLGVGHQVEVVVHPHA